MSHEMFYVSGLGVSVVCETRPCVLFWVTYILDRGGVPSVKRITPCP